MPDKENPGESDRDQAEEDAMDHNSSTTVEQTASATVTEIGPFTNYVRARQLRGKVFRRTFIVEGLLEQGRIYEFFGGWKEGKTNVVVDMCAHASQGKAWAGRRTVPSLIVYVAGESEEDIQMRVEAYQLRHGINSEMPFVIRIKPVYLTDAEFADDLYREILAWQKEYPDLPIILVIDTLARNFGIGNENSPEGMGAFSNNLIDIVVRPTKCACAVLHHSGHSDSERSRGHSSFAGAVDGSFKVSKSTDPGPPIITLKMMTTRSGPGGDEFSFRIDTQMLPGGDNFGNEFSAPILRYLPDHIPEPKNVPTGKHIKTLERITLTLAKNQFKTLKDGDYSLPENTIVLEDKIRKEFYTYLADEKASTKRNAWNNNIDKLKQIFTPHGNDYSVSLEQVNLHD